MSKLIIIRGLPGSGKSTFAHKLADKAGLLLIEPDALVVTDGKYDYTPHRFMDAVDTSLTLLGLAASSPTHPDCVYADVLPTVADVERVWYRYLFAGSKDGKELVVYDMPLISVETSLSRNRHGVREEDVKRMHDTWQDWPGALSPEVGEP
jgi:hypothetical protein